MFGSVGRLRADGLQRAAGQQAQPPRSQGRRCWSRPTAGWTASRSKLTAQIDREARGRGRQCRRRPARRAVRSRRLRSAAQGARGAWPRPRHPGRAGMADDAEAEVTLPAPTAIAGGLRDAIGRLTGRRTGGGDLSQPGRACSAWPSPARAAGAAETVRLGARLAAACRRRRCRPGSGSERRRGSFRDGAGLVYDRRSSRRPAPQPDRDLSPTARFRCCVRSASTAPSMRRSPRRTYQRYARQVPAGFSFVVKAPALGL